MIGVHLMTCVEFQNAAANDVNSGLSGSKQTVPRWTVWQWYLQKQSIIQMTTLYTQCRKKINVKVIKRFANKKVQKLVPCGTDGQLLLSGDFRKGPSP